LAAQTRSRCGQERILAQGNLLQFAWGGKLALDDQELG
jgi:hypothetical protein